jgi:hypothetical protein
MTAAAVLFTYLTFKHPQKDRKHGCKCRSPPDNAAWQAAAHIKPYILSASDSLNTKLAAVQLQQDQLWLGEQLQLA